MKPAQKALQKAKTNTEEPSWHKDELDKHRMTDKATLKHGGQKYRVGRMSYGDYFLEPGKPKGETQGFNSGTRWLEKHSEHHKPGKKNGHYIINKLFD